MGIVRANEVLVEQPRVGSQHGVDAGVRHDRACRGDLQHPKHGRRLRVFLRLAGGGGEAPQRGGHPCNRLVQRRGLGEVDPRHAQVRRVRKPFVRDLAALERARQLDVVAVQHIYYDIVLFIGISLD